MTYKEMMRKRSQLVDSINIIKENKKNWHPNICTQRSRELRKELILIDKAVIDGLLHNVIAL